MIRTRSADVTLLAGWLFADLLLAFAVIVLGSSSGEPAPVATAVDVPTTSTTTTLTTVASSPSPPTRAPGIDLEPVKFSPNAIYEWLVGSDPGLREFARAFVRDQAAKFFADEARAGRRAGFVLTFGIHPDAGTGQALADVYNELLREASPGVFADARMRSFDFRASERKGGANVEVYFLN